MPAAISRAAIAPVLSQPRVRAEQVTQLVLGEAALVVDSMESGAASALTATITMAGCTPVSRPSWTTLPPGSGEPGPMAGAKAHMVQIGPTHVPVPMRARVVMEGDMVSLPDGRRGRVTSGQCVPCPK